MGVSIKVLMVSDFSPGGIDTEGEDGQRYIDDPYGKIFAGIAGKFKRFNLKR